MNQNNFLFALGLTIFAGLSTCIGSLIVLKGKKINNDILSISLGFAGGVMLYVSFAEILIKGKNSLILFYGEKQGNLYSIISFFLGILLIILIDKLIPDIKDITNNTSTDENLLRMGIFTALAIAIHNFPEGLATFTAAIKDPSLGFPIALAIAIHNIPEGVAVAVPIYFATKSKSKALFISLLSGVAEPIGGVIGYVLLSGIFNDGMFGFIFSFVSGVMVYISIAELLPSSKKYSSSPFCDYWAVFGMLIMALSLLLFI